MNPYQVKDENGNLGKYKISPRYLPHIRLFAMDKGYKYNDIEDFLNNPSLQDRFYKEKLEGGGKVTLALGGTVQPNHNVVEVYRDGGKVKLTLNNYQDGGEVKRGTKEYREAYNQGTVTRQLPDGTFIAPQLREVVIEDTDDRIKDAVRQSTANVAQNYLNPAIKMGLAVANPMMGLGIAGIDIADAIRREDYQSAVIDAGLEALPYGIGKVSKPLIRSASNLLKTKNNPIFETVDEISKTVKKRPAMYEDYNLTTGKYDLYEMELADRFFPTREYADVSHKMSNLKKDLNIDLLDDFLNKLKLNNSDSRGINLEKDRGLFFDPKTGALYDSNTRYWLSRQYGNTPDIDGYLDYRGDYIFKNLGKKSGSFDKPRLPSQNKIIYQENTPTFQKGGKVKLHL